MKWGCQCNGNRVKFQYHQHCSGSVPCLISTIPKCRVSHSVHFPTPCSMGSLLRPQSSSPPDSSPPDSSPRDSSPPDSSPPDSSPPDSSPHHLQPVDHASPSSPTQLRHLPLSSSTSISTNPNLPPLLLEGSPPAPPVQLNGNSRVTSLFEEESPPSLPAQFNLRQLQHPCPAT